MSWRWPSSALASPNASASAFSNRYSCRCHVRLSLNTFSLSTPSTSSSLCTGIKARLQSRYDNNKDVKKWKRLTVFEAAAKNVVKCTTGGTNTQFEEKEEVKEDVEFDCVGTGQDVDCLVSPSASSNSEETVALLGDDSVALGVVWEWAVLVSPFFFWGTAMVAMKEVIPKCGPFFVSAFRLIPAGFLLIAFATSRNRPFPSGLNAWLSISLFALVDAACFQVILFILSAYFCFRNNELSAFLLINIERW